MREDNVEFVRAEIIKFEKPGIPVDKKRHHNKKDPKPVSSDDVTEIDPGNELDDVTAVDDAMDDVTTVDSVIKDDLTLIDDEMTIVDAGNDDVTQVD